MKLNNKFLPFQPKFSDDNTHEVVTPPAAQPMALIQKGSSSTEHPDKTIPTNELDSIFQEDTPTAAHQEDRTLLFGDSETPKSAILKTHKRMSNTVLIKKGKRQLVGEDAKQQQRKPSASSKSISEDDINSKPSVAIPNSELEASTLLDDIKERRVSTMGLNDKQVINLAKLIATMTGTDESMVYQLISLLPKKNEFSNRSSGQSYIGNSTNGSGIHPALPNHNVGVLPSSSDLYTKPISSVIPIHNDRNQTQTHLQNINYMQSTTSLPEQRGNSYPQPLFERPQTDHRLAVSVSPVRNNSLQNNLTHVLTSNSAHQINDSSFNGNRGERQSFIPLPAHTTISGEYRLSDEFFTNPQLRSSSSTMTSTTKRNFNSFGGGVSHHDSVIHSDSIVFPHDVDFDVCCNGVPSKRVIQIKNSNKCWIQIQFNVAFFAFNGREVCVPYVFLKRKSSCSTITRLGLT